MENDLKRLLDHPLWREAAARWEAMTPEERAAEHTRMEEKALEKARQRYMEKQNQIKARNADHEEI